MTRKLHPERSRRSKRPAPTKAVIRLLAIIRIGDTSIVIRDDGRMKRETWTAALAELKEAK